MNLIRNKLSVKPSRLSKIITKYYSVCDNCDPSGEELRESLFIPVQVECPKVPRRITICGVTSEIGRSLAYNLIRHQICDELVLIDKPKFAKQLCGTALDLIHGKCYFHSPNIKVGTNYSISDKSELIILCSGQPSKETATKEIAEANIKILKEIVPQFALHSPDCVFLVAMFPIEIIGHAVWKFSCFPKNRIVGVGTGIENTRFKYFLGTRIPINPMSIHSKVIGDRGNGLLPLWNTINVAGTALRDIDECIGKSKDKNKWYELFDAARTADQNKALNNWNIATNLAKIAEAIITDSKTIRTVALRAHNVYDLETDAFMSFPAVLGNRGISHVVQQCLTREEMERLHDNTDVLNKLLKSIKF